MHGIHPSIIQDETDSNWSTIFNLADRLHGTLRLNVPQQRITVGLPAVRGPEELTLVRILAMPARSGLPGDGRPPELESRDESLPAARGHLAA
jgi:hypothetical protein